MAKKKGHLHASADVVRSVLKQERITAACGETRVLTREDIIDDDNYKVCQACITAAGRDNEEYTVLSPRGWTALLEKVWLAEHSPQAWPVFRFTLSQNGDTFNWPLAG